MNCIPREQKSQRGKGLHTLHRMTLGKGGGPGKKPQLEKRGGLTQGRECQFERKGKNWSGYKRRATS